MLLRRSPQNPCYVGILAGEDGLRPTVLSAFGFHVTDKMIKRQMYGRADFALLRKRVMLHPA
jgi:hypothetical protein